MTVLAWKPLLCRNRGAPKPTLSLLCNVVLEALATQEAKNETKKRIHTEKE